jgi:hypothetical protein
MSSMMDAGPQSRDRMACIAFPAAMVTSHVHVTRPGSSRPQRREEGPS